MFDKRLFQLAPGLGKLIAGKVALMWVGLLANIGFMLSLVMLLQGLLAAADPHTFSCNAASASECPANLFGVPGTTVAPMAGDLMVYVALAIVCMLVRYLATTHATRLGTEAAEQVKLALRSKLYRKMVALGPSYRSRVKTSDVVQSAGEGVEQIQSFFELFLPQLFYAILAPITLFAVIAPINMPAAVTMLVCAPLIIIVTGIVSMTAARAFKKYWGRYTDMGAAFLDNLQGLETLKNFDADDRAAAEMDKKAEGFRVMTMRVLQIQLRSLTAMDIVAYGGAAAGIGVALWQYAHTAAAAAGASAAGWSPIMLAAHLPGAFAYLAYGLQYLMPFGAGFPLTLAGLLLIVLLSAEFFIPMRQLGSYFHVAMNGMTSTKRIFALLDTPEPAHGTATLPATAGTDAGTDAGTKAGTKADGGITVSFDHVGYSYDSADSGAAVQQTNSAPAPALTDLTFTAYPGQLTAIVGISGSGKSTAAALLAGTLTGYQGSLTLNGVKVSDLSGETLARTITLIGASSHLFAGTLRENLLMALPDDGQNGEAASDAVDSRLWDALEQARIADFVRSQPDGLDMTIEPDAANLSGGQRQRIAIARALLHDSPVFVFDEATSSVDVESEELILATIRELVQSRSKTVIMITHRMANAEHADQVVVLEHGKSVETGTHAELMAAGGVYAKLFTTQADIENFGADHPQPASLTASASGSGAAAGIAINLAGVNLYDIPALVAAFALLASSFGPTLALAALPANLTQTFASARRLFGLMDEAPAVVETGTANSDYEGMRLDRVTFAYPGEGSEAILADFSLDVPQHGILGIQGPSGRGKSTMLKLLMRYWDPQRGQVTLSGTPLPQIDVHARRRIQAMMSQETHLFDGTIRENLLIALPESEIRNGGAAGVLDARLREALAKASVLDLIDSLPDGLDTQVGELGDRLSEGERQRIGLARVFLRNADLVLFDEPTSRLDALNEAIILRSIHELSKSEQNADKGQDVAVVLVSHRESAMRVADAVLNL